MPRINRVPESDIKGSLALKILRAKQQKNVPFWIRKGAENESLEQRYRHNRPPWEKKDWWRK